MYLLDLLNQKIKEALKKNEAELNKLFYPTSNQTPMIKYPTLMKTDYYENSDRSYRYVVEHYYDETKKKVWFNDMILPNITKVFKQFLCTCQCNGDCDNDYGCSCECECGNDNKDALLMMEKDGMHSYTFEQLEKLSVLI